MAKSLKKISLLLLLAVYVIAANGMVLETAARLYSTGDLPAVALHGGLAKDLPEPSLTPRTYTSPTPSVPVLSAGYVISTVIYPAEETRRFLRPDEALPSYTADFSSTVSDRAPPAA